jgi:hypothetical protein
MLKAYPNMTVPKSAKYLCQAAEFEPPASAAPAPVRVDGTTVCFGSEY